MARHRATITNDEVARILREMALYLEMHEVQFKPRAYEKAAYAVETLDRPLAEIAEESGLKGIEKIPSVGKGIAGRIHELVRSGRMHELEDLRKETPVDIMSLTHIESLGPRGVKALYDHLGVRTIADLEDACRKQHVRKLSHFGRKTEEKLLRGIELLKQASGRHPIGVALPLARRIEERLRDLPGVDQASVAGSVRRRKETIGDLDFLVVSKRPERVMQAFIDMPEVEHVMAHGHTKTMVRLTNGIDADLRVVPAESFGAALAYFTGSKDHNLAVRRIAQRRKLKLNEYGLFRGKRSIAGRTEKEVYEALDLDFVPPELRENRGEVEAAREGKLPKLIGHGQLRGDLQIQTSWTDGTGSIADLVDAARELGLEYIAITDHTRDLPMTRGLDEKRLLEQAEEIRRLNRRLRSFRVLAGAEVNIRKDGSLDIDDEALAQLDVVGAAVHSFFDQPRAEATRRVVRAMESPHVDILFHPTGRQLGRREPLDLDIDEVIRAARRTGTVLEIDAIPDRLDLRDEHVHKAVSAGVKLVIDSDAHHPSNLRYPDEFGIPVARRGWARKEDVLNTLPVEKLLRSLKGGGRPRRRTGAADGTRSPSRARKAPKVRKSSRTSGARRTRRTRKTRSAPRARRR